MANASQADSTGEVDRPRIEILRIAEPEFVECDLLPPEAFPDAPPTERERRIFRTVPRDVDPLDSPTVWHRLASSCSGWVESPTPAEFCHAVHAATPTARQQNIVRTEREHADAAAPGTSR